MLTNTMTTILIFTVIVLVISLIVQHNRLKQSFTRYSTLLKRNDDLKAKKNNYDMINTCSKRKLISIYLFSR